MFVSEIMSTCVTECTEDMGLEEVYNLLRECEHGFVVVVDSHAHRVPIGIVSERSICEQIIIRGRNPRSLFAGAVMDSRMTSVMETDLVESIDVADDDVRAAIVVTNSKRQVCGLVSSESLRGRRAVVDGLSPSIREEAGPSRTIDQMPALGWIQ
jgi:predicted transcriptional regulator